MIALPSFVLGREFSKVWEIYNAREREGVEGYEMNANIGGESNVSLEMIHSCACLIRGISFGVLLEYLVTFSDPRTTSNAGHTNTNHSTARACYGRSEWEYLVTACQGR